MFDYIFWCAGNSTIPPTRWLFSVLVPVLLMVYGLKRKGVNRSGATLGLVVAITLSIASHAFLACLATFFFSSSRVTRYRDHMKRKIESDFKGGILLNQNYLYSNIYILYDVWIICRWRKTKLGTSTVQWWYGHAIGCAIFIGLWPWWTADRFY